MHSVDIAGLKRRGALQILPEMPSHREIAKDWNVSPAYVDQCVKRGCPTATFEAARLWRQANQIREPHKKSVKQDTAAISEKMLQPMSIEALEKELLICQENMINAKRMLDQAYVEQSASKVSTWMNLYYRAAETVIRMEGLIREAKVQAGILITKSEAQMEARRAFGIIVQRLTAMPQNLAARVNPHNPGHAMDILQVEVVRILEDARNVYA